MASKIKKHSYQIQSAAKTRECMICFQDMSYFGRSISPCYHYICSYCLKEYVTSEIKSGKTKLLCPHQDINGFCHKEWRWSELKQKITLPPERIQSLETNLNENILNNSKTIKKCPYCYIFIRNNMRASKVTCPACAKEFCWSCLQSWSGNLYHDDNESCQNAECGGKKELKILKSCERVHLNGKKCPSIRACVNCGTLIKYKDKCKHVKCSKCGQGFCFICLKKLVGIKWSCSFDGSCVLAPRQTIIPKEYDSSYYFNVVLPSYCAFAFFR